MKFLNTVIIGVMFLSAAFAAEKPNIIWMVSEDNGARWLGCYGNPAKPTPNLDKLATRGFRFTNTYASVPVCAPQRFTWITGINAISCGTQGMRSGYQLPEHIKFYPEIFKKLGYYTSKGNDSKTDYNFRGRNANDTWDDPKTINWDNLKKNQPFIHVFNTHDTHEWNSFGGFKPEKDKAPKAQNLAAYHPDIPGMHYVYDKYNKAMQKMDQRIAGWLKDLEDSGMADNTIVIYSSDHGGVLPRSKRYLYNSGTHCPLIIYIPEKLKQLYPASNPGSTVDELVSFTDFPKTWLSLAGANAEDVKQMQGRVFLGDKKVDEPKYVYSFRNRMDDRDDMVRSSRDHKYLYIRNYMPFVPVGQYQPYIYNSESMRAWRRHYLDGKTNEITGRYFKQPRAIDELYLYNEDYDNVKNLAAKSEYTQTILKMRQALRRWQLEIFDAGFLPEDDISREAKKHDLTVYEFIRKPELYPLEKYIDIADKTVELNNDDLPEFLSSLKDKYLGMRYWGTLGILNLSFTKEFKPTPEIASVIESVVNNQDESEVIRAYAAWILVRLGEDKKGLTALSQLTKITYSIRTVCNILDWMDPKAALPVVSEMFISGNFKNADQFKVATKTLIEHAPQEMVDLVLKKQQLHNKIKTKQGRLKKLKKSNQKLTPEKLASETEKAQKELNEATAQSKQIDAQLTKIVPKI